MAEPAPKVLVVDDEEHITEMCIRDRDSHGWRCRRAGAQRQQVLLPGRGLGRRQPSCSHKRQKRSRGPVSYTHLDVYKRQMGVRVPAPSL